MVPSCPNRARTSGLVILCIYARTIRTYEFGSEVPIEARMRRTFLPELATVTQSFGTLNDHDNDRRTESRIETDTRAERCAPRSSSLGIFFRFVQ